jgi:hypothetical protein
MINDEAISFRLLKVENPKWCKERGEGGWATTSWEGESPRYAPLDNIMEMECRNPSLGLATKARPCKNVG